MKSIVIDGIEYELIPKKQKMPLICELNGIKFYLGPEATNEMNWKDAVKWCAELGDGFELPSREIALILSINFKPFCGGHFWTSCQTIPPSAFNKVWYQHWNPSYPEFQFFDCETNLNRVRAVYRHID